MSNKQVIIEIKPDGVVRIDAQNFAGVGCAAATKGLELALAGDGGTVEDRKKDDFFATNDGATQQNLN